VQFFVAVIALPDLAQGFFSQAECCPQRGLLGFVGGVGFVAHFITSI
jgi:hypothetical protein